jgi:hypothetical protein
MTRAGRFGYVSMAEFRNQDGSIFWIQRNRLQLREDFVVPLEILGPCEVSGPYQPLDEHYTRTRFGQFEESEVALHRGVSASRERDYLHPYVRQRRHVHSLGQLADHDLAPAHHPAQRRFVEDDGQAGRIVLGEDALPGELGLDLQADLPGLEPGLERSWAARA